ncbi:MAG: hypothetical protein ACRDLB_02060 [Actinomycetota bacterium]
MGPSRSGLHDEIARAHLRGYEERADRRLLVSRARAERRAARGRRGSARVAGALRAAADRLDRPAAECR